MMRDRHWDTLALHALSKGNGWAVSVFVAECGRRMMFTRCTPEFGWRRL